MVTYTHCEEVRDEFSALLDGELSSEELDAVEAHLSQCADCLRALDGMKQVDNLFSGMENVRAPEDFEDRVLRTVRPKLLRFSLGPIAKRRIIGQLAAAAVLVIVGAGVTTVYFGEDTGRFDMAKSDAPVRSEVAQMQTPAPVAESSAAADNSAAPALGEYEGNALGLNVEPEQAIARGVTNTASRAPEKALADSNTLAPASPSPNEKEADFYFGAAAAGAEVVNGPVREDLDVGLRDEQVALGDKVEAPLQESNVELLGRANEVAKGVAAAPPADEAGAELRVQAARRGGEESSRLRKNTPTPTVESERQAKSATVLFEKKKSPSWTLEERNGAWFQIGYAKEKTTTLTRDSQTLQELIAKHPTVAELLVKKTKVVFRVDDTWYTLNAPVEPTTLP